MRPQQRRARRLERQRRSVDQLLAVSGNFATYSVRLANLSRRKTISLIPSTTLAGAGDWRSVASGPVNPARRLSGGGERTYHG